MTDTSAQGARPRRAWNWRAWRNRKVSDPGFQSWASANPLTRRKAKADGEQLFSMVAGFVQSQVLFALVELGLLEAALEAPITAAQVPDVPEDRAEALLSAAAAMGLMEKVGQGYQTARLGAATLGVPGLTEMIRHHDVLYRDLANPVALLRGEVDTELSRFWPYVFGAGAAEDPATAARYSRLMADSQSMVAEETLRTVDLSGASRLMDVGGGTGAFLRAVSAQYPDLPCTLFDLPAVLDAADVGAHVALAPGSFRDDSLPRGADVITLVRVLYDHSDETVRVLLAKAREALGPGGRLIISEPMTGGGAPHVPGDVYFAFYCMAMGTGRARSPEHIQTLLREAGFDAVKHHPTARPFVTSVVDCLVA